MGTETPSPNPHHNQPHTRTRPPLSVLDSHPGPLLPQLGLPSIPLPFRSQPPKQMGLLTVPQKGLQKGSPSNLLEVQMPLPAATTADPCRRSGGSSMGPPREKALC
ncbi:hypothetical protein PIB30_002738 [Stylosanthes scabra]|uniref:Uncharacterized protein n=1 Tax=Stylosanthes scabra TaxID=79078 RepID=A0ABU6S2U1_9FABA|nr:hypothetical protein [Stylosanthes scabra]